VRTIFKRNEKKRSNSKARKLSFFTSVDKYEEKKSHKFHFRFKANFPVQKQAQVENSGKEEGGI